MTSAVFFDLDGTLTDPKLGITRSIRHAMERLNLPAPPEDELTWCIGPPLRSSLVYLVGEAAADQALSFYRDRFVDIGLYENSLYFGVPELLSSLGKTRLFVATSKPTAYAKIILTHFGIADHFEEIFGSELDGTRADKSDLLKHALNQTGISASDAIMVGDRSHDMIGARNNGMGRFGVLYGYGSEQELRDAGATKVFGTPQDLRQVLRGI